MVSPVTNCSPIMRIAMSTPVRISGSPPRADHLAQRALDSRLSLCVDTSLPVSSRPQVAALTNSDGLWPRWLLPVAVADLVADQRVARGGVGNAQQRLGQAHQRHAFLRADARTPAAGPAPGRRGRCRGRARARRARCAAPAPARPRPGPASARAAASRPGSSSGSGRAGGGGDGRAQRRGVQHRRRHGLLGFHGQAFKWGDAGVGRRSPHLRRFCGACSRPPRRGFFSGAG